MNDEERAEGRTFPNLKRIRDVSHNVAVRPVQDHRQPECRCNPLRCVAAARCNAFGVGCNGRLR
jgi:hypothetical protein